MIEFSQREVETLIHGDFHGGNHKFGVDQKEGEVIVYDFQITGGSLASIEVLQALCNIEITNYSEVDSIIKGTFLKLMVQTSMTSLLTHTVAHSIHSLRPKTNNQPNKKFLSLLVS